ncbi:MAG: hypothetical protein RLZZ437_2582 [Pseudomonadota bacterium]|jgi:hypothetical protein
MQAPAIRQGGNDPSRDGDVNLYISPEAANQSWFQHSRRVIFVNGMDNSPRDHASSAVALSMLQGCPVIGVYNRTDGKWADLGQCITDKLQGTGIVDSTKVGLASWVILVGTAYNKAKQANPSLQKTDFVGGLVRNNPATYALYSMLVGSGGVSARNTAIVAHSQGNLITSNALTAVACALGTDAIAGIEVHSYGSPCRYWPPGINRKNNLFTLDPVGWLDLRADLSSAKVGTVAGHAFTLYMQNDAAFVINRYRFGGLNMTLNLDEQGLARTMIRMGPNAPRVRRILERLRDVHWTDSDDVALHYVEKSSVPQLRAMKQADPGVIRLLIALLESGPTMADEERAITKLNSL